MGAPGGLPIGGGNMWALLLDKDPGHSAAANYLAVDVIDLKLKKAAPVVAVKVKEAPPARNVSKPAKRVDKTKKNKKPSAASSNMAAANVDYGGKVQVNVDATSNHEDREVKQDHTNQLMGKLKKFDGRVLHTANEDGERGNDDATALPEDCGDGSEDGGSGPKNHDSGLDDSGMASKDSNDDCEPLGNRAVQLLAICANFPICEIMGYDYSLVRRIYVQRKGEVQEEGMVDLVPIGPRQILMAYGYFGLDVYTDHKSGPPAITEAWDVEVDDEIEEYTRTISADPGRKLEITYLVIPNAIGANVEVKLKLKDLGSKSRAVYGKIKASATDYRNKSIHLFSCERGTSLSFSSGSTSILPLSPSMVAVPCRWQLELHIEVHLTVIICDSQEEQYKTLKFSLEFTREIMSQKREVDDDQVEVNIKWCPIH